MNEFVSCLISKNGLAYLTGAVIFFLTLFLTSKKIIGFSLTVLFLIFALIAAMAVSHQDLIRSYFTNQKPENSSEGIYKANNSQTDTSKQASSSDIHVDFQKALDDLKQEFLIEKLRLQKMWEDFNNHVKKTEEQKTEKSNPPPASSDQKP
jgi:hypothetical protein